MKWVIREGRKIDRIARPGSSDASLRMTRNFLTGRPSGLSLLAAKLGATPYDIPGRGALCASADGDRAYRQRAAFSIGCVSIFMDGSRLRCPAGGIKE
ncbi:MAG: hypothetical protein J2P31_14950 [Blastocatellia bacterium]|nr:hypothetical protein [Blastocatellia bacterium]